MHTLLTPICVALDELAAAILGGWGGEQTFQEAWGWHCLPMTRHELHSLPLNLSKRIRDASPTDLGPVNPSLVQDLPRRLKMIQANTLPQLYGGNNPAATQVIIQAIGLATEVLEPILRLQVIEDPKAMPPALAKRIRSYSAQLNQLDPDMAGLEEKVKRIKDAHDAAESLPADMEALAEARGKVQKIEKDASGILGVMSGQQNDAAEALSAITKNQKEAAALVDKCDEAYRITTSVGLAAAFDQRATSLNRSMWVWVIALFIALGLGALLGADRVDSLSKAVAMPDPHWGSIALQIALSVLSVGGPLWVAWLATKQIGQRFRLAEDYAFKASVAKAYEGYRKEAARIDEVFEARLFSSALARLEEAPLRLVEGTTHGSPWHEFMSSPVFQQAVETVPNFKSTLTDLLKQGADALQGVFARGKDKEAPKALPAPPAPAAE